MDIEAIAAEVEWRNREALLETPVTAIYSRGDAVVAWQACIDRETPHVEHVEVKTTHLGFGFSPDVYKIIAQSLARTTHESSSTADAHSRHRHKVRPRHATRAHGLKT
jgi:hypothetical protein